MAWNAVERYLVLSADELAKEKENRKTSLHFDEEMEDEIRVTVIATGFEEKDDSLPDQPFTRAGEKVEEKKQEEPDAEEKKAEEKPADTGLGESDFDAIFQIFNKKK